LGERFHLNRRIIKPSVKLNRLRIIGGRWRGRRFNFPAQPQIRPTPDRVRETLFNWLTPRIMDARCLDLFAGSGALGLEALSRGAGQVIMVERDRYAAHALQGHLQDLDAPQGQVLAMDAFTFLAHNQMSFDVVFLDPPFAGDDLARACKLLADSASLAQDAMIYLECPRTLSLSFLPTGWVAHRSGHAGQVQYHLFHNQPMRQDAHAVLVSSKEGLGSQ